MNHNAHRWVQGVHKTGSWIEVGERLVGMEVQAVMGKVAGDDGMNSLVTYFDPANVQ